MDNGELEWADIEVCHVCQVPYPPSPFGPATGGQPNGPWEI